MAQITLFDIINSWSEFGLFDSILPFFIMFSIFYVLLTKTKIFGDSWYDKKTEKDALTIRNAKLAKMVNLIVSFGASMYVVANIGVGVDFPSFLYSLFGASFMVILSFILLTIVAVFGYAVFRGESPFKDDGGMKAGWTSWAKVVIILALVLPMYFYFESTGNLSAIEIFDITLTPVGISINDILEPYIGGLEDLNTITLTAFFIMLTGVAYIVAKYTLKFMKYIVDHF